MAIATVVSASGQVFFEETFSDSNWQDVSRTLRRHSEQGYDNATDKHASTAFNEKHTTMIEMDNIFDKERLVIFRPVVRHILRQQGIRPRTSDLLGHALLLHLGAIHLRRRQPQRRLDCPIHRQTES